jgi:hypothetical protein
MKPDNPATISEPISETEWEQMFEPANKNRLEKYLYEKYPNGWCGHNSYYILFHPWKALEYWWQEIVYAYERVKYEYDRRVVWSIDWYLSEKIPLWMRELKEKTHGTPVEMFEGMEHDNNYNYSDEDDDIAQAKWQDILEEIAVGFESYCLLQNYYDDNEEYKKELNTKFEKGFDLLRQYWGNLWD